MKSHFTAAAAFMALTLTTAATPAMAKPPLFFLKGCTADKQTLSTHIVIVGSDKNHDETKKILSKKFSALTAGLTGAQTQSDSFDAAMDKMLEQAKKDLGASMAPWFPGSLKPGCHK